MWNKLFCSLGLHSWDKGDDWTVPVCYKCSKAKRLGKLERLDLWLNSWDRLWNSLTRYYRKNNELMERYRKWQ